MSSSSLGGSLGVRGPVPFWGTGGETGKEGRRRFKSTTGEPGGVLGGIGGAERGVTGAGVDTGAFAAVVVEDSTDAVLRPRRRLYSERDIRTFSCFLLSDIVGAGAFSFETGIAQGSAKLGVCAKTSLLLLESSSAWRFLGGSF